MNTDEMYGNRSLYAIVYITVRRRIAFPLYLRNQSIQGYRNDTFAIECYSEAEVSWYIGMTSALSRYLTLLYVDYISLVNDGYINSVDGGDNLEFTPAVVPVRDSIDGKIFGEVEIRETYIDKEF